MAESRLDTALRITAALLPTLLIATYAALALGRWLPLSEEGRWAVAYYTPLVVYGALACIVMRMRSGVRAWLFAGSALLLLKLALVLV